MKEVRASLLVIASSLILKVKPSLSTLLSETLTNYHAE